MYIDAYALISQQDGDVGDSLQREGMYAFGKWLRYHGRANVVVVSEIPERREPQQIISKFEVEPGVYVRHPDPTRWSSDPDTTSRDQLVPVIAYCAAYQDHARLWRLFEATAARGFFAQNTVRTDDPAREKKIPDTMIGHLGLFIRAGGYYTAPLYPLLLVTDTIDLLGTLLNTVPIHWEESNERLRLADPGDVDDNNTVIIHLMAATFKPTPISWLNRKIYALTRPINNGNIVLGETNPVMGALAWYHREAAGGNPEIAELYRPMVDKFFSNEDPYTQVRREIAGLMDLFTDRIMMTAL